MQDDNVFILSWDCNGLESVVPLGRLEELHDEAEKDRTWKTLQTGQDPGNLYHRALHQWVTALTMRARLNSQRNYEVYSIHTTPDITKEFFEDAFKTNRDATVKLIRERGNKIYG
jgi:hypothetical protein